MIKIAIADKQPLAHYAIKNLLGQENDVEIAFASYDFDETKKILNNDKSIDILLLDLDVEGVNSVKDIKRFIEDYPTKIILYTSVPENMYAATAIKAGVSAHISKERPVEDLITVIREVYNGTYKHSDYILDTLVALSKGKKSDRLHKKLSNRELEVLHYLDEGKKNKEIAVILGLDEKTISTYKLRLLSKLDVTNLIDLLTKAKTLNII